MTIRWTLTEMAEKRGVTGYKLAAMTGLTRQAIYHLMREPIVSRIDGATLDSLCRALKCKPGALLEHIPD